MALKLGTLTPTALYLGTTAASAAYLGATQVYSTGVADAYAIGGASPELVAAFTLASDGTTAGEYFRKASSETTFGDLFTFSRSGTATYFDSNGTLQTAADGVARRNAYYYNGTSWVKGGLLAESAAATNLFAYSDLSTGWTSVRSTWTANSVTENGISFGLAEKTNRFEGTRESPAMSISGAHTVFFFVKKGNTDWCHIRVRNTTTSDQIRQWFDLSSGALGSKSEINSGVVTNASITPFGSDVFRLAVTFNVGASGSPFIAIEVSDGDGIAEAAIGKTVYAGQADLIAGAVGNTSPIITTGSTVTRAAETLSIAGADTPANTTAMSISMKGLMTYADEGTAAQETFLRWHTDANNFITLDLDTDSTATGEVNANQSTAGTLDTVVAGAEYSPGVNVAFNIASRHTSGAVNVAKDGTAATADTTPTALADLSGTALTPGYDFSGFISELRVWGSDIGDSGIEEVTS